MNNKLQYLETMYEKFIKEIEFLKKRNNKGNLPQKNKIQIGGIQKIIFDSDDPDYDTGIPSKRNILSNYSKPPSNNTARKKGK